MSAELAVRQLDPIRARLLRKQKAVGACAWPAGVGGRLREHCSECPFGFDRQLDGKPGCNR
jgi:hypothetical protein